MVKLFVLGKICWLSLIFFSFINPIKTHITEHEVLPREGIKTTMARSRGNIYKDLTAPTQGT